METIIKLNAIFDGFIYNQNSEIQNPYFRFEANGKFYYFENDPSLSVDHLGSRKIDFTLYPNPVSEELTIELTELVNYQIRITDITGREIYSEFLQGENNLQLSTKAWPAGLYLLQVRDEEGRVETKKVVKN